MTAPLKADVTAAERLLKAAVRRAVEIIASADQGEVRDWSGRMVDMFRDYDRAYVENMLANATHAAELLLSERAS